ncbi:YbaK/EbsC family protein [Halovivax limisalsi]|uniref:YbaK/EbsC family protein n=1 Tax=Halovivax limisalsi TaxID=1453760 RepID=UPI001FFD464E|nr:YbaK/EbsC family protein [Halovivax limisalsi]
MHERAAEFLDQAVDRYGFEPPVHEFPEGTKTAADAADAIGCETAQIASSLAFDVDGELIVVVASGASRVSEDRLAARFETTPDAVSMADPDRISDTLGWTIGGVPPICHETTVPTLFDRSLSEFETVWAAAGTPSAVFPIAPDRLCDLADAEAIEVATAD